MGNNVMVDELAVKPGGGIKGRGSLATSLLANGMNTQGLRTLATLRKDEWKFYDDAVLLAAVQRRIGVADLMQYGLTLNLTNGMGTTVLEYEDMSDITDAEVTMDGRARVSKDRPEFDLNYLPLPLTHKDWDINARVLAASRTRGDALDTTMASLASRKVAEKIEEYLFIGSGGFTYGGGTIYGYMNHPDRNEVDFSADGWELSTGGEGILTDVRAMKAASISAKYYGPWMLYVPTNYETTLDDDFKSSSDKTTRQRLLEIGGILDVKVADKLTASNVVLVQMTPDVVRLVNGMDVTNVEWDEQGGMVLNFKVMAIQVPQIRADQDGNSGIVHLS